MSITYRTARQGDLPAINSVIERAITTWQLPDRVKRLSLPLYRYTVADLGHLELCVAEEGTDIVGLAAWEPARSPDLPEGTRGLLLHGLYVDPGRHRQGVGTRLLTACLRRSRELGLGGVLVKAHADAESFFRRRGMKPLPVRDELRDYARRYWRDS